MAALSPDDLFIPLPTPDQGGTPILKWVLSRPNTHLFPLHLLTTGRGSLDVVQEEIVVGYDEESPAFDDDDVDFASRDGSRDDVIDESNEGYAEIGGGEEEQTWRENLNEYFVLPPTQPAFLQNPHDATSSSTMMMEPMDGIPLPPVHTLLSQPPPPMPQQQPLLQTQELIQQLSQHAAQMIVQHLQQLQPDQLQQLWPQQPPQPVQHQQMDVVDAERDRIWRPYEIVLPPSPIVESKTEDVIKQEEDVFVELFKREDDVIEADSEVKVEDDDVKDEDEEINVGSPMAASAPVVPLSPGAMKAGDSTLRARLPTAAWREMQQQQRRHWLTGQQRAAFRGIFARVLYLNSIERQALASAFGITPEQVRNMFSNRGGRSAHRKTTPMSTEEALGIIREELHKFGLALKDDDVKKKMK